MPPQGSAAADVAAPVTFDVLPLPLALRIFASLPADARLLAAAVCRSWRVMLADPALWTRLDVSKESCVRNPTSDALLSAAAARAGGQLQVLRVSLRNYQPHQVLLDVLTSNAGTLRELALCTDDADFPPTAETVAALLRAAPGLRRLETGVAFIGADALPVLRKEPPFGLLCLKSCTLHNIATAVGWGAVADGLALHSSLEVVRVLREWPEAQAERNSMVDALLSLPLLRSLTLRGPPASVLARLLGHTTLKSVCVFGGRVPLLDSPALLCDALRANTQLELLILSNMNCWRHMDAATALLATLHTHPSLKQLDIRMNRVPPEHAAAVGAALGALIAHSPALETLGIYVGALGDAGLGPIMDALPHSRLQILSCHGNRMSEAFARERLLPAVRACASLRKLNAYGGPAVGEAKLLLEQRR